MGCAGGTRAARRGHIWAWHRLHGVSWGLVAAESGATEQRGHGGDAGRGIRRQDRWRCETMKAREGAGKLGKRAGEKRGLRWLGYGSKGGTAEGLVCFVTSGGLEKGWGPGVLCMDRHTVACLPLLGHC